MKALRQTRSGDWKKFDPDQTGIGLKGAIWSIDSSGFSAWRRDLQGPKSIPGSSFLRPDLAVFWVEVGVSRFHSGEAEHRERVVPFRDASLPFRDWSWKIRFFLDSIRREDPR
jgi:hypothetical protein